MVLAIPYACCSWKFVPEKSSFLLNHPRLRIFQKYLQRHAASEFVSLLHCKVPTGINTRYMCLPPVIGNYRSSILVVTWTQTLYRQCSDGKHLLQVFISAPYWIINRSGLPLIFKQEGTNSESAGQFPEHEQARSVAPLLFSFADSEASMM